jgi:hypothetical protein
MILHLIDSGSDRFDAGRLKSIYSPPASLETQSSQKVPFFPPLLPFIKLRRQKYRVAFQRFFSKIRFILRYRKMPLITEG